MTPKVLLAYYIIRINFAYTADENSAAYSSRALGTEVQKNE